MDILKLPSWIIYKERKDLRDFGIGTEGTVGDQIYKCLKKRQWMPWNKLLLIDDLRLFNEAYYLCTVIIRRENPIDFLVEWEKKRDFDCLTFLGKMSTCNTILGMVYVYLGCLLPTIEDKYQKYPAKITREFISRFLQKCHQFALLRLFGYADPIRFLSLKVKGKIQASEFDMRKPNNPIYKKMDWGEQSYGYNPGEIYKLISFFGRNHEERLGFLNVIIKSAEKERLHFNISQETLSQLYEMKEKISNDLVYKNEVTIMDRYRNVLEECESNLEEWMSKQIKKEDAKEPKPEDESIPHFPLIKEKEKGVELYENLIVESFIHRDTKRDCWLYVMGFTTEKPAEFKPIDWLVSKELARSLIEKLYVNLRKEGIVTLSELEELVKTCFIHKGKQLKLNSRKPYTSYKASLLDDILKDFSDPS